MTATTIPRLDPQDQLLTTRQLAEMTGTAAGHWSNLRSAGRSPIPFCRIGSAVRYRLSSVEAYLEAHTVAAA